MHEQTKTSLKKFKGYSMGSTSHDLNTAIKVEPVFHTSTRGRYLHTRGCPWYRARCANPGGVSVSASAPVATTSGKYPGNEHFRGRGRSQRPLNPPGLDGKLLRCSACGSYRHLIKNCPDTWENSTSTNLTKLMTPVITKTYTILTVGKMLHTWQRDSMMNIHLSLTPLKIYACTLVIIPVTSGY